MKIKHWLIYQLCFFIIVIFGFYDCAIRVHSKQALNNMLFGFFLGTIGMAMAFIWEKMEE